jgi:phosphatidylserine/phosphatidylglycerophosphate/cardiolipin synthase-like enzyme
MWNSPAPIADLKVTVVRSMHLKSYEIDSKLLRTGAANFSASGLKRQDNDLIVIHSANAAAEFEREFDSRFAAGEALPSSAK